MKSVVKMSRTVDEAIHIALEELGANKEDVRVEVLEEPSKGLFGLLGVRDAAVRVTVVNDPVQKAENFLDRILLAMDIKGNAEIRKEGRTLLVEIINISSSDMGIVIGKRGNTLDAIQYLLSLMVNKDREEYIKVIVDVKNYRERREKTLIRLANKMANRAKYSNRTVRLEPMNPYERRIIHSAIQNIEGIVTYSEGEDPYRRVVIQAKRD